MSNAPIRLIPVALLLIAFGGCGAKTVRVTVGQIGAGSSATSGAPSVSTKNTTRIGGATPIEDAAAVARTVYPGATAGARPAAVVLVNPDNWAVALVTAALASAPLRAPLLYDAPGKLPDISAQTLRTIHPTGAHGLGGAQVVTVGGVAAPAGYTSRALAGNDPYALAAAVEQLVSKTHGPPRQVIIVDADGPAALAMPAAGLAAESGAPILLVNASGIPPATSAALRALKQPALYVVGPSSAVSHKTVGQLRHFGSVTRITGADPVSNSIAVAQFTDGSFGWGITDPGHGLVFANQSRPLDAPAAALLSASGQYGPLLLLDSAGRVAPSLARYLSDIQPGYTDAPRFRPVRGVYNHGWLIGDERASSAVTQAGIDGALEIAPRGSPASAPTP
jgi:ell wall binding domain 2 (CWB2)